MSDNTGRQETTTIVLDGAMEIAENHLAGYGVASLFPGSRISWESGIRQHITIKADRDTVTQALCARVRSIVDPEGWLRGNHLVIRKTSVNVSGAAEVSPYISPFQSDTTNVYEGWDDLQRWSEVLHRDTPAQLLGAYRDEMDEYEADPLDENGKSRRVPVDPRTDGRITYKVKEGAVDWELIYARRRSVIDSPEVAGDTLLSDVIESIGKPAYWGVRSTTGTPGTKETLSPPKAMLGATPLLSYAFNSGRDFVAQNVVYAVLKSGVRVSTDAGSISDEQIMEQLERGLTEDPLTVGSSKTDWRVQPASGVRVAVALLGLAMIPSVHRRYEPTTSFGVMPEFADGMRLASRKIAGLRLPVFDTAVSPWRITTVISDQRWYSLDAPSSQRWVSEQGVRAAAEFPLELVITAKITSGRLCDGVVKYLSDFAGSR